MTILYFWASLNGSAGKIILLQCGRPGFDPWVGKIPWRRERLPILVFWIGEFHGLYSPWGRKELDTIERLKKKKRTSYKWDQVVFSPLYHLASFT